jgi:hypothetical protein
MWAGKDPWRKDIPTADNKKHDAVVVGQVMARDAPKTRKMRTCMRARTCAIANSFCRHVWMLPFTPYRALWEVLRL